MTLSTNLIPINTRQISSSIQSLIGRLPSANVTEIQQYSTLNQVLPDALFVTGSFDQIRQRVSQTAETYISGLPIARPIFSIPSVVPSFPPKRPSYGQIKNFINTKIDRIKQQRQQASIKALNEELKQRENPFKFRQSLQNNQQVNTVLGRFTNQ
jgi:hypothetical protein